MTSDVKGKLIEAFCGSFLVKGWEGRVMYYEKGFFIFRFLLSLTRYIKMRRSDLLSTSFKALNRLVFEEIDASYLFEYQI